MMKDSPEGQTQYCQSCNELAQQVETMREALSLYASEYNAHWRPDMPILEPIADTALALPKTAADILRQRDARTLREAAKKFSDGAEAHSAGAWVGRCIEQMADALENGK